MPHERRKMAIAKPKQRVRRTSRKAETGVDVTLIDWMLQHTPAERLQILQKQVAAVLELRHAKTT